MKSNKQRIQKTLWLLSIVLGFIGLSLVGWQATTRGANSPSDAVALPNLQGAAATEYLKQQGLYNSLSEAMAAARDSVQEVSTAQQRLTASDAGFDDRFGYAVAISGETVVVGAPFDDGTAGSNQGAAYVFVRAGTVWTQQRKLTANDTAAGDEFGRAVAISDETIVVGSPRDGSGDQGSINVFVRAGTTWTQQQHIDAFDGGTDDQFGSAVAISGETIVVGAPFDNGSAGADRGSVYIYVRAGTSWSRQDQFVADDAAAGDQFGSAVAISSETIVVGAPLDDGAAGGDQGAAYIYRRAGTIWAQSQKITANDAASGDQFGFAVGVSGQTIVVGAPLDDGTAGANQGSVYAFVRAFTGWGQQQKLSAGDAESLAQFGYSVAISGEALVVGVPADDGVAGTNQGSAYVFARAGAIWTQQQQLTANDAGINDQFGYAVAMNGETVVVGVQLDAGTAGLGQGSVRVFACTNGSAWVQEDDLVASAQAIAGRFGDAVAISGETIVIGAPEEDSLAGADEGAVYVFVRAGTTWTQQTKLRASDAAAGDRFGSSVALSGETMIVGAPFDDGVAGPDQGSAYVYVRTAGSIWTLQQKLTASDAGEHRSFGFSVGIGGETIVIGDPYESGGIGLGSRGAAYIFVRAGAIWTQQRKLTASDADVEDNFGWAVGISGETVVVGARFATSDPSLLYGDEGAVYVFVRAGTTWTQQQKLQASDRSYRAQLGFSVAISGETLVVGAPFDDNSLRGAQYGAAYVFVRAGTTWTEQWRFRADEPVVFAKFGESVGISGETIVITAPGDGTDSRGSIYIFERAGTIWTKQQRLTPSGTDYFGGAVGISEGTIVFGPSPARVFQKVCIEPPTISCPSNITANAAAGQCSALATFTVTATGSPASTVTCTPASGSVFPVGMNTVNCTASNGFAPDATCSFTVTVLDGQVPIISACPGPITATAANGQCTANVTYTPPTTTDNCGAATVTCVPPSGSSFLVGVTTVTCTASDASPDSPSAMCGFTVTVRDTQSPVLSLPSNIIQNSNTGVCNAVVHYSATATDNCSGATVTCSPPSGASFNVGTTTVTCTASDASPNSPDANGSFTVTIRDTQAPIIGACPSSTSADALSGQCAATVSYTPPTATDNCGVVVTCAPPSGSTFPVGVTTVTCTASDTSPDSPDATCSFTVTVRDQQSPVLSLPQNITRNTDAGVCKAVVTYSATATDNCGNATVSCSPPSGASFNVGTTTVTCIASDASPNSPDANGSFTVTVQDAQPPTVGTYSNTLVSAGSGAIVTPSAAPADNCGIASVTATSTSFTGSLTANIATGAISITNANPPGNHTINVIVTDNTGTTAMRSFTLTINPSCGMITINPSNSILSPGTVGAAYSQSFTQTGGTGSIAWSSTGTLPGSVTLDANSGLLSGTPTASGTFAFTVTATDANNCPGSHQYSLTINPAGSGLQFYPLAHPVRLLDTRAGQTGCDTPGTMISGGTSRTQTAAGRTCDGLTIPANAKALTGNVTTVESDGGFLTLYPSDITRPLVANSNFAANQVLNNVFTVGLGAADGAFNIYVTTNTNVVIDITGYYAPPSASGLYFHPLPKPVRLMDTRAGQTACFTPGAQLTAGSTITQLGTTTCDGVLIPAGAQALVGNATAVSPQANGFLTLFPADAMRPLVASSNFQTGINMNAPFTVGLSPSGQFNIYTAATTDLVVDVLGYFSTQLNDSNGQGLLFNSLPTPVRLLDTRAAQSGCFTPGAQMIGGTAYLQPATGACTGIPIAAKAVVGNVTTVNAAANGFLTFWPSNANQPNVTTSNYRSGTVFNRHFTVGLGAEGAFKRFAATTTDLVVDISGFFAP